ncbi:Other/CAMKK/ELM protein kinase [Favolaschia claudopus]|uniref:Other/CAMKK/ELM protein kinase n=1 Tax=Favolaschia claudopus TaxID=2862362 RepID=A0AAV9ZZ82_9AGAR
MDRPPPSKSRTARKKNEFISIRRQLGKGHNAVVYLVDYNTDPVPRAMKKIPRNNKRTENLNRLRANNPLRAASSAGIPRTTDGPSAVVDRRGTEEAKIRREIAIMKKCDHPNIIKFFAFVDDKMDANICLIMEYMEGGELQWQTAEGNKPYLTLDQTRRVMRDVVLGLQYLHEQGIIHRDIKPSNIMWTADRTHVKIGDFGVAHFVQARGPRPVGAPADDDYNFDGESDLLPRHAGTPAFLAPEITPGFSPSTSTTALPLSSTSPSQPASSAERVGPSVDLWALGVTLFGMLFGSIPFSPDEEATHAGQVAAEASLYRVIREEPWAIPQGVTTVCANAVPIEDAKSKVKKDWRGKEKEKEKAGSGNARQVLELMGGLLEKDVSRRWEIEKIKSVPWLLYDIQRRDEWQAATTPRITVSATDEKYAILEPKVKWNFRLGLGRRFSNLFRSGTERDREREAAGEGPVRSAPSGLPRRKGKERARERDPGRKRDGGVSRQKSRARSVDTARVTPPLPAPPPVVKPDPAASSSRTLPVRMLRGAGEKDPRRGFFRWGSSPPPVPTPSTAVPTPTTSTSPSTSFVIDEAVVGMKKTRLGRGIVLDAAAPLGRYSADVLARHGADPYSTEGRASTGGSAGGSEDWSGEGDMYAAGKGMIVGAVSVASPVSARMGLDPDDDEEEHDPYEYEYDSAEDEDDAEEDERGDGRGQVYDHTSSGESDEEQGGAPIEFRGARKRTEPTNHAPDADADET